MIEYLIRFISHSVRFAMGVLTKLRPATPWVHGSEKLQVFHQSYDLTQDEPKHLLPNTRRVLNLINYTKQSKTSYSADIYENAYHTIELDGIAFPGQRNPRKRLESIPFDFTNATILDLGCNQGGMLFTLSDQIEYGIGLDYDKRMINAANRLRSHRRINNLDFYVFDIDQEDHALIDNFLQNEKIDIVFILSVCLWINRWQSIIKKSAQISEYLLFESNGTSLQQDDQEAYLRRIYRIVNKIMDSSPDDPLQKQRRLFLCRV